MKKLLMIFVLLGIFCISVTVLADPYAVPGETFSIPTPVHTTEAK